MDTHIKDGILREAFKIKNGQIREFLPIGWVGGHPNPKFLTGF